MGRRKRVVIGSSHSAQSLSRRIRLTVEVVAGAENAIAAGEIYKATPLYRDANRAYIAILCELTRLSGQESEFVEPAFTELEVRLERLSNVLGTHGNQNRFDLIIGGARH